MQVVSLLYSLPRHLFPDRFIVLFLSFFPGSFRMLWGGGASISSAMKGQELLLGISFIIRPIEFFIRS